MCVESKHTCAVKDSLAVQTHHVQCNACIVLFLDGSIHGAPPKTSRSHRWLSLGRQAPSMDLCYLVGLTSHFSSQAWRIFIGGLQCTNIMINNEVFDAYWGSRRRKAFAPPGAIAYHAAHEPVFEECHTQVSGETAYLGQMR
jgi:hypothetical protein